MLKVLQPFIGHGYDFPQPGDLIDPKEPERGRILAEGLAAEYEVKVTKPPAEVKKKKPSASLPAAPRPRKKMQKKRTNSAKS